MEGIDAVDDLFERPVGNDASQHSIGIEKCRALARKICRTCAPGAKSGDEAFVWQHTTRVPALGQGATQLIGVPASSGAEDSDLHYCFTNFCTARFTVSATHSSPFGLTAMKCASPNSPTPFPGFPMAPSTVPFKSIFTIWPAKPFTI